jgi:EcsC protein family
LTLQETTEIAFEDEQALRDAVKALEHPSLAGRLTNIVGKPVELIGMALPSFASKAVASATSKGLEAALKVALRTLPSSSWPHSQLLHRALATASGAVGGTFGLAALPVELPASTVIMLRSIADIARSEGEDLSDLETALACVEVFPLGGHAGSTDASESGYFAVRSMLAKTVTEAARFVAERGVIKEGAPILLKFVTQVGRPLRRRGHAEGRGAGSARRRRARRRCGELRVHGAFSGDRPRALHRAPAGADLRRGADTRRVRCDREGALGL